MTTDSLPRHWWLKLPLALLLLSLLLLAVWRARLAQRVNTRLDAIVARGEPTTFAELDKWYAYPKGQNPADALTRAFQLSVEDEALEKQIPGLSAKSRRSGERWSDDELAAARQYLALNQPALAALESSPPGPARFPLDPARLTNGDTAVDSKLPRRLARLLNLRAIMAAQAGDPDSAARDVIRLLQLAEAIEPTPTLICALITLSVQAMAIQSLRDVHAFTPIREEHLLDMQQRIEAMISRHDAFRIQSLVSERAFCLETMQLFATTKPLRWAGVLDHNTLAVLDVFDHELAVAQGQPTPALPNVPPPFLADLAMGSISGNRRTHRDAKIMLITARCGVAVMRFQQVNGRLPDSLDELTPAFLSDVPIDPHSGAALVYRRDEHGWVIYSVGADGADDGGRETNAQGQAYQPGADVPFSSPGR